MQKIQKLQPVQRKTDASDIASKLENDIEDFENSFRSLNIEKKPKDRSASPPINQDELQKQYNEIFDSCNQQKQQLSDFQKSINQKIQDLENNNKISSDSIKMKDKKLNELEEKINHTSHQLKSVMDVINDKDQNTPFKERDIKFNESDISEDKSNSQTTENEDEEKGKDEEEDENEADEENIEETKSRFPFSIEFVLLCIIIILEMVQFAKVYFKK